MQVTRKSVFSGDINTLEIDVTEEQMALWKSGVLIQTAMPNVPQELREFILTGATPAEWDSLFKEED
jgi:hypothetical protein